MLLKQRGNRVSHRLLSQFLKLIGFQRKLGFRFSPRALADSQKSYKISQISQLFQHSIKTQLLICSQSLKNQVFLVSTEKYRERFREDELLQSAAGSSWCSSSTRSVSSCMLFVPLGSFDFDFGFFNFVFQWSVFCFGFFIIILTTIDHQTGYPPKDAYPPPGYPQQGYPPPQGYPQQGYPQQGYAPQYAQQPPHRQESPGCLEGW